MEGNWLRNAGFYLTSPIVQVELISEDLDCLLEFGKLKFPLDLTGFFLLVSPSPHLFLTGSHMEPWQARLSLNSDICLSSSLHDQKVNVGFFSCSDKTQPNADLENPELIWVLGG